MALTLRETFRPAGVPFDPVNLSARYRDRRYAVILAFEAEIPRPYYDSAGLLTVGVGFNLRDSAILDIVLAELGVAAAQRPAFASIVTAGGPIGTVLQKLDQQLGRTF